MTALHHAAEECAVLAAENARLREALAFIAKWGGKEIEGVSCSGSWCAEQARRALDEGRAG